jgi:hypothetical protein
MAFDSWIQITLHSCTTLQVNCLILRGNGPTPPLATLIVSDETADVIDVIYVNM